ncbi:DUF2768 family protein [Paenibacillus beijingensis]|uniref:DUF2768 domain-containing protein n=1 Tax=Paenibacillus beijingensis TaxID=1126833 RepID=A0A0D5NPG4_9BACL|nr:DUF2768 family protein [Paenibacillus beijingensis]AJY77184.1 hypothetical protein VN24_24810 [Paenibacillus beijingensis]
MDPMTVMWISLVGIGLMVVSAVLITFARLKTKGFLRIVLTIIALGFLMTGFLLGVFSIIV